MHGRLILFFLMLILGGCGTTESLEQETRPPEVLYEEGVRALKKRRYKTAIDRFQELDRKHPFSPLATRAQSNLIYAHFKKGDHAETISAAERFIRLHPRHQHVSYAYYMRGLGNYKQISVAYNDQGRTRDAIVAFKEVISRFPDSDYAWEAERMLLLCRDRLAEQEIVVARYYLDREEYIAAISRFSELLNNKDYAKTPYLEEALFSLVMASLRLGLTEEARNHAAVLGHNFPDRPFYKRAKSMIEGKGDIYRWELEALRRGVGEGSKVKQFFQGLAPALVSGPTNSGM